MDFILANWETIGLILSNIVALFMHPPFRNRKSPNVLS